MSQKSLLASLLTKYSNKNADQFSQKNEQSQQQQQPVNKLMAAKSQDIFNNRKESEDDQVDLEEYYDILLNSQNQIFKQKVQYSQKIEPTETKESIKKIFTPAKPRKKANKKQKLQFYNPFDSIKHFNGDKAHIIEQVKEALQKQEQLVSQANKFGLKTVKALGNVKCKKQMNNIISYMQSGELPAQYVKKMQALIAE